MSLCFRVLPGRLLSFVNSRKSLSKLGRYQLRKNTGSTFMKQFLDTQRIFARASTTSKTSVPTVDYVLHQNLPLSSLIDTYSQWSERSFGRRLYRYDDNVRRNMTYWSQMRRSQRTQRLSAVAKNRKHIIGITSDDVTVSQTQSVIGNVKNNSFLDNSRIIVPILEDFHRSPGLSIRSNILFTDVTPLKSSQQQSSPSPQDTEGKPSQEQMQRVFDCLSEDLPKLFVKMQNYAIYTEDIIFINNIRGVTTKGLMSYVKQLALLKALGHVKFAFVKFDIIKITMHIEDATVRVRWRIRGVSTIRMLSICWKYKLFNIREALEKDSELWYDGFSTYYVNSEGKVYKHIADKVMPDQDVAEKKDDLRIAPKLALFRGLTDVFNNDECFSELCTTLKFHRLE
ncbi:PREDICTED: uncharacterized protein LOC106752177 [Dinoponera quadriceps]|uniref:Uncharacterized protein LOC106752177 n=1 Tax=Dinoponera quadriceps TaxID=609295 RepID=A0A6P3YDL4_DINQU|nr:PREDICTED: uncharacterized protein LOC106752177 [Dinoponera quadriceps]